MQEEPDLPIIDVSSVLAQLVELERSVGMDDAEATPVVVCERISRTDFTEWLDEHDRELRHWEYEPLSETHGRVMIYRLASSSVPGAMNDAIRERVMEQVVDIGGGDRGLRKTLVEYGDWIRNVGDRPQAPDSSFLPTSISHFQYPTVVVEVAYKNETLDRLRAKLQRWMRPITTVQVAIGVKIDPRTNREHKFIVLQRSPQYGENRDPLDDRITSVEVDLRDEVAHFHTHSPAVPRPQVGFPLALLYHGVVPLPPQLQGHEDDTIQFDLLDLLTKIENALEAYDLSQRNDQQ